MLKWSEHQTELAELDISISNSQTLTKYNMRLKLWSRKYSFPAGLQSENDFPTGAARDWSPTGALVAN